MFKSYELPFSPCHDCWFVGLSTGRMGTIFSRVWAMPNSETFSILPIKEFVKKYIALQNKISVDCFSRNVRWATYTNDLNPATAAEYHMDAESFLQMLADKGIVADLVICDPPYSPRQVKECYDSIGLPMKQTDALLGMTRKRLKAQINRLVPIGGVVLHFGWNTVGMGKGWAQEEILLVCHGSDHNDTICMAERRMPNLITSNQLTLTPEGTNHFHEQPV